MIKYAVVDTAEGTPITPVHQLPTPVPVTPQAVAEVFEVLVHQLSSRPQAPHPGASVGVALPAVIRRGIACSAANIDDTWIGLDVEQFLTDRLGRPVHVLNDADAAGLTKARYGAGRGEAGRPSTGTVLVITLGTGIGSALFVDGKLVPNLELGHLELGGVKAEARASAVAREREDLDWPDYAGRLQQYVDHLEFLFSPDLIIIGGGNSARHEDFLPHLHLDTPIVPAQLRNAVGIIGAARHTYLAAPTRQQRNPYCSTALWIMGKAGSTAGTIPVSSPDASTRPYVKRVVSYPGQMSSMVWPWPPPPVPVSWQMPVQSPRPTLPGRASRPPCSATRVCTRWPSIGSLVTCGPLGGANRPCKRSPPLRRRPRASPFTRVL